MNNIQFLTTLYINILQVLYWKSDIQVLQLLIQQKKQIHIDFHKIQDNFYKLVDLQDEIPSQIQIPDLLYQQHKQNYKLYFEFTEIYNQNIFTSLNLMDSVNQYQIEEIKFQIENHFTGNQIWTYKTVLEEIQKIVPLQVKTEKEKVLDLTSERFNEFLCVFNEAEFTQACKEVLKFTSQSTKQEFRKIMGGLIQQISDSTLKSRVLTQLINQMVQFAKQNEQIDFFEQYLQNPMFFKDLIKKQNSVQILELFIKNNALHIITFIQLLQDCQIQDRKNILEKILNSILFDEEADPIDNLLCLIPEEKVYDFVKVLSKFYGQKTKDTLQLLSDNYEMEEIIPIFNKQNIDKQTIEQIVDDCFNEPQENIKQIIQKIFQEQNKDAIKLIQQLNNQNKIEGKTIAESISYVFNNSSMDQGIFKYMLNVISDAKCFDLSSICQELDLIENINKQMLFSIFKSKNNIK